jgi:anhydro-N-acetylmuramic acid kinase
VAAGAERLLVGLMSGTSCDGVDSVVCALRGDHGPQARIQARLLHHGHRAYEPEFADRLRAVGDARAPELARLHVELGARFGQAAAAAVSAADLAATDVLAVALPGHTAVHLPPDGDDAGATLALGDGDVAAEVCGCLVVSDMRARDRAAGGQGAPLVPHADACLLRPDQGAVAALNLGGIANVTVVPATGPPVAFDTGPANMVLDGALRRATGGERTFDEGGALGLAGVPDLTWVARAVAEDPFVAALPPKSTGRERYGEAFLDAHWPILGALGLPDLAATLVAHTVETVAVALERFGGSRPGRLVVSGGGAANGAIMAALSRRLEPMEVVDSETALSVPIQAREALAFALLADATLSGAAGNVPTVTGARRGVRLGKLCLPPRAGLELPPQS